MDHFRTAAKLWPGGSELGAGIDATFDLHPPDDSIDFADTAAPFMSSADGTQTYQFLFWNTGRHLTRKRKVTWLFKVFGWGTWTATKWYGTPPGGGGPGGPPRVRADAFSLKGNAMLSANSPIDGTASTYAAGAWPFNGDDHAIGTAAGAANVVAKDPFGAYDFAGWLELQWGGDPTDDFAETDDGTTGVFGGSDFYEPVSAAGNAFPVDQGNSADLLAAYAPHPLSLPGGFGPYGPVRRWWEEIVGELGSKIPQKGDPSPMDLIRLRILEQFMRQTLPGPAAGTDFQRMIDAAPNMSKEELKRTIQSLQTTLDLGKAALTAIEAQMKRK
jgi:hypothetical protein